MSTSLTGKKHKTEESMESSFPLNDIDPCICKHQWLCNKGTLTVASREQVQSVVSKCRDTPRAKFAAKFLHWSCLKTFIAPFVIEIYEGNREEQSAFPENLHLISAKPLISTKIVKTKVIFLAFHVGEKKKEEEEEEREKSGEGSSNIKINLFHCSARKSENRTWTCCLFAL
ncbi:hypothetical protein HPG69_008414 [Diceros bicornis minor]|uniref:Uncharacterized protein n=1 Tax=Diceros bicornis minor TaxID=77932 RepID=A0A7J7ENH3_DICBM|nr:hypothetical protein HPG69_008414 [Diceros bicornis minor]